MFKKRTPTLADIYLKELGTKLDATLVPLFEPGERVELGTIGRYTDGGRFEHRGHLRDLVHPLPAVSPPSTDAAPGSWLFASDRAVELAGRGTVTGPLGQDLVAATLSFNANRAVVAAFTGLTETRFESPRSLDPLLWKLYLKGDLAIDEVVVWSTRPADTGTVVISRTKGTTVELTVDPAVMGGALSLANLGAGIAFSGGSQASFQYAGSSLVAFVRTLGLVRDGQPHITNIRRFRADGTDGAAAFDGVEVPEIHTADFLAGADFDAPEDDEA
jgi:hypothetical protein